jgi:exonuclease VII small subunit
MKNFSYYKNNIDSILENSFKDTKKFKKNLSVIMGAMKFSKTLREFFTLYNDIESKRFKDTEKSITYLNEAMDYLKSKKKNLKKVKPILDKIIKDRKELCEDRSNVIYKNIDNIVFNNKISTIELVAESKQRLTTHLISEKKKNTNKISNPKILSHVLSKNYSEVYGEKLTENQQEILKNTLLMTEDTLKKEFDNVKEISLNKINSLLSESKDETLSAKLVQVKNEIKSLDNTKKSYIRVRGLLEDLK